MTIKTILIADGTPVMLRRGFQPYMTKAGVPVASQHGEPIFIAEGIVPGLIAGRFATDRDRPEQVRIRVAGTNPAIDSGVIRLEGQVTATAWYTARERGSAARSDLTITAERVTRTTDRPIVRGGLPAVLPTDVPCTLLGQTDEGLVDVMFDAAGIYAVDGITEVQLPGHNPMVDDLVGQHVRPLGLRGYFIIPDDQDVSARSRSELVLAADGFEAAAPAHTNGSRRRTEPTVETADA